MKKKLTKILGVGLTVMLLASLVVVTAPAAANPTDDAWETLTMPSTSYKYSGFVAGPIAQAIDGTLFAYCSYKTPIFGTSYLKKSTDDGHKWSDKGKQLAAIVDIACSPSDADIVYVATATEVRASIDGGTTFITKVALTGETITSIDVGELGGNHMILIGTTTGSYGGNVYLFNEGAYPAALSDMLAGTIDILDVAVSPNFGSDQGIFAVGLSNSTTLQIKNKIGGAAWGSNLANITATANTTTMASIAFPDDFNATTIGMANWYVGFNGDGTDEGVYLVQGFLTTSQKVRVSEQKDIASLAVTGNAGGSAKILAGLTSGDVMYTDVGNVPWKSDFTSGLKKQPTGASNALVLMADDFASSGQAWATTTGLEGAVSMTSNACVSWNQVGLINTSIDVINDLSVVDDDTIFMATDSPGDTVLMTANTTGNVTVTVTAGAVAFTPSSVSTANPVAIVIAGSTATITFKYAGPYYDKVYVTATADGTTATYAALTGTSTNTLYRDVDSDTTVTQTSFGLPDGSSYDSIWRYASVWERVWSSINLNNLVGASPDYGSDGTVFTANKGTKNIHRSTDGGDIWVAQTTDVPSNTAAWVVVGQSELMVGASYYTYRTTNNGLTWIKSPALYGVPYTISKKATGYYMVGTTNGYLFYTLNSGESWNILASGAATSAGWGSVKLHALWGDKMWAAPEGGGVYRYDGTAAGWVRIDNLAGSTNGDVAAPTGLVIGSDGTLYAADSTGTGTVGEGVSRCLPGATEGGNLGSTLLAITYPYFERVNATGTAPLSANITGLWLTEGSNKLWTIYADKYVYTYVDTLSVPVTGLTATVIEATATLEWDTLASATSYTYEVNTRDDFLGTSIASATTTLTTVPLTGLDRGVTYYWRVRTTTPVRSLYSDTMSFSAIIGVADISADYGAPRPGATDVPTDAVFTWKEVSGATSYQFQITEDLTFYETPSLLLEDATSTTNTYVVEGLAYSTIYYWRVKAIGATTESAWVNGVFTTMAKPVDVEAVTPDVTVEQPDITVEAPEITVEAAAPAIPEYLLWTVIAIGALLIISLIILIVRTRRVA